MDEDIASGFVTPEMMPRGDSSGKEKVSKSKVKEIPRYLQPSTGSCHDLCKYGKKQIPVEKPWKSTTKKIFKKALDDDLNETLKPATSKSNKVMEAKKKSVTDDSSEIIKREIPKYQVSGGSSGLKKQEAFIIPSGDETTTSKQMKKKMTSPSTDSGSRSVDTKMPKVLRKSYSTLTTSKSKVNHEQVASSSPVLIPKMGKISRGKGEDAEIKKAVPSSKVALKKVPLTPRASLSPRSSVRLAGNSSLRKTQSLKSASSSKVALKKVPVTPRASLSPRFSVRLSGNSSLRKTQSLKSASSSSARPNQKSRHVNRTEESNKQLDVYPVEEKTLHVVEMETTNNNVSEHDQNQQSVVEPFPPLSPTLSPPKDDEYTVSETEGYEYPSESNEAESEEEEIDISNGEKKPRTRNEGESLDEDARKLQFRRGKVVDVDTVGESARKLKFRRGRDVGEDKAHDAQNRRSFKKREDIRDEEEEEDDGEKVVLRHQDVQEKDAQGLLNNVIEETASKLVEARKSKVKALVGAFETVISLQESKPPANSETGHLD